MAKTVRPAGAPFMGCTVKTLPDEAQGPAAQTAIRHNPANAPPRGAALGLLAPSLVAAPARLALLVSRYWGAGGVRLTVGFVDQEPADLRARLVGHMNAWGAFANVTFAATQTDPQVRVSLGQGGYWSYLGTDILHIPAGQQTMNLEAFTMQTPESEFVRVVRHETGHTLGFPHEHLRAELVARLDPRKTIRYFQQTQGWSQQEVIQQVLTPLDPGDLQATPRADEDSIMAYALPGAITTDGRPITGGVDIDAADAAFAGKLYPRAVTPPPPPPPGGGKKYRVTLDVDAATGAAVVVPAG